MNRKVTIEAGILRLNCPSNLAANAVAIQLGEHEKAKIDILGKTVFFSLPEISDDQELTKIACNAIARAGI